MKTPPLAALPPQATSAPVRGWLDCMRTSEVLAKLADARGERLTLGEIFANLGDRSFALLVVILGLPNCIPMPPPIPLICALLLLAVALQIAFGRRTPWAPHYLLMRSVAQKDVRRAADRAMPYLTWLERWSRPRMEWLHPGVAAGVIVGVVLILLALGLLTAAPFIGQIPWGLAVCLLGLGLVERDGVLVIAALIAGVLGAFLSAGFVYAIFVAVKNWLV